MSQIPHDLKYSNTHEWVKQDEDSDAMLIGISDHAQKALGDIVFVELPEVGSILKSGEELGVIESVKAASDLICPISGEVMAVNERLTSQPDLINKDPYHEGWILKLIPEDPSDLEDLLDADEYAEKLDIEEDK